MSAYVVADETINKIVSYLYAKANGPDPIDRGTTKLGKMGFDFAFTQSCLELAQKMFDLNVAAVQDRDGEAEDFALPNFKYVFTPASQIDVIKALKVWKYQCNEGDVPDTALYKAMIEVHCLLCIDFVEQSEEYEAAPWG